MADIRKIAAFCLTRGNRGITLRRKLADGLGGVGANSIGRGLFGSVPTLKPQNADHAEQRRDHQRRSYAALDAREADCDQHKQGDRHPARPLGIALGFVREGRGHAVALPISGAFCKPGNINLAGPVPCSTGRTPLIVHCNSLQFKVIL